MTLNPFRRMLEAGNTPIGSLIFSGNAHVTEMLACQGYDFLVIDAEHTLNSLDNLLAQVRAVESMGGCVPLVRPAGHDPVQIKLMLDTIGVQNFLFPFAESVDEARALSAACTYPPKGCGALPP